VRYRPSVVLASGRADRPYTCFKFQTASVCVLLVAAFHFATSQSLLLLRTLFSTMASAPGSTSKAAPVIEVVDDSEDDDDGDEDSVDDEQLEEYREMVENLGNFPVRTYILTCSCDTRQGSASYSLACRCCMCLFLTRRFLFESRRTRCKSTVSPWWRRTIARRKRERKQYTI
jgi:hypothetical protein